MGENHEAWPSQLANDLENFYMNQGLQLIGGYSSSENQRELKFIMYNTIDNYNVTINFDLEVETLYGSINDKDFEFYLNAKYSDNKSIFITVFSINRSKNINELNEDPNLLMHIVIFQNLKLNYDTYDKPFKFIVKKFQWPSISLGKEDLLINIIDFEKN